MEGDRDILSSHAGLFDKQLGGAGKERGFLFGRAPATEKDLDDQHSVRAGDVEIFGIIDEPPAAVLGDDLKLIALRHAEAFDHGAMNGIANRGELFIGTTLALIAAAVLLGVMTPFIKKLIPNEDKLTGE